MGILNTSCMSCPTIENPSFMGVSVYTLRNAAFPHAANGSIVILNFASSCNMVIHTMDG